MGYCIGFLVAILLSGCGGDNIRAGTITEKEYTAAHSEGYYQPIPHTSCNSDGQHTSCHTSYTYIYSTRWVSDHWDFKLELCTEGDAIKDRSCKHGEVAVDETTFHQYKEGDFYGQVK
jgi:hypothetical protein